VTIEATSFSTFRRNPFALAASRQRLLIREPWSSVSELLTQDAVLFAQAVDHLQLTLVHPPGNRDEDEPERIQGFGHRELTLNAHQPSGQPNRSDSNRIEFRPAPA
jgi:hypothetical protein